MELLIAERIKKFRKERDMTQDALASALGISPQSISKWECGDVTHVLINDPTRGYGIFIENMLAAAEK